MKQLILMLAMTGALSPVAAQKIQGKVTTTTGEPLIAGNITMIKALDSTVVKYAITEADGAYELEGMPADTYIVKADDDLNIGYSAPITYDGNSTVDVPTITLAAPADVTTLEDVVYTYQRPMVEMKADRMVFNVDSTINSVGQNGLELLRKSPGVLVDKDENITMSGKNGIRVYIDGRPSPLTGSELSEYLKTMQSNAIDYIEIVNNPSAKYDAAGNAGIINIVLKKNKMIGTNGTVNLGYSIGVYGKYNGGLSLNHRNGKVNLYGTYNVNTGNSWNDMRFDRTLGDSTYLQKVNGRSENFAHNYKAGVDYFVNDHSTLGVMVNGNSRNSKNFSNDVMTIQHIPSGEITRQLFANNETEGNRSNINANLNYQYSNKTSGKTFTADIDYGRFDLKTIQLQPNAYYDEAGNFLFENVYKITAPTVIDIYSGKVDYEQNFLKGKLGVGAKVSMIETQNDFDFQNKESGSFITDIDRSNQFNYKENIQAAYATYSRQFPGMAINVGLRAENTQLEGVSAGERADGGLITPYSEIFKRDYFNLFPSVGITFNKNPMNQLAINYSKRIDRPNYQDLNPFEFKMNDYTFRKGNIHLAPQITNSVGITHTFMYMINTRLEYSNVTSVFAELVDTIDGNKFFQTKENLATQDMISLNISVPYQYKKWSFFGNVNAYYSMFKADYGAGRVIDLDVFSFNTYGQISYKVNSWLTGEMSGWYTAPSIWQGTFRSIAMGGIDVGAQARILKQKGTLKLSVGDIFRTMRWGGSSDFAGQYVYATGRWESTQLRLNFSYNFGNNKLKTRQRSTAAEEEKNRAGESSGGMSPGAR